MRRALCVVLFTVSLPLSAFERQPDADYRVRPQHLAARLDGQSVPLEWLKRANSFPNYTSYRDPKPLVGELRVTKDAGELALIGKASDATVEAHKAAMRNAKPGMTENELSAIMQYEFERRGCEAP